MREAFDHFLVGRIHIPPVEQDGLADRIGPLDHGAAPGVIAGLRLLVNKNRNGWSFIPKSAP